MVIWRLPLTYSKTNIVLCLVDCTCTATSLKDATVRPWKAPRPNSYALGKKTHHQVLSKTYCTLEKTARGRTFYQTFHKMTFLVCGGEKKSNCCYSIGSIVPATQTIHTLPWGSCYCLFRTSVHRQMSIVYPDKQYLGVSGRVPRWCGDKSIIRWQLCLCSRLAHAAQARCSAVSLSLTFGGLKALCPRARWRE